MFRNVSRVHSGRLPVLAGCGSGTDHGWRPMRRLVFSPLNVVLVLVLMAVAPQQAFGPSSEQVAAGQAPGEPVRLPLDLFNVPDGLEVTSGRRPRCCTTRPTSTSTKRPLWVAEAGATVTHARQPEGDSLVVLQDTEVTARPTRHPPSCRSRADRAARRVGDSTTRSWSRNPRTSSSTRRRSQPDVRSGGGQAGCC